MPSLEQEGSEVNQAICAADRSLIAAETSRNLELAMAHVAPDVILQPLDRPMVVGREAVRESYAEWFALPFVAIQVHAQTVTVAASGDLAYLVGEFTAYEGTAGRTPSARKTPGRLDQD